MEKVKLDFVEIDLCESFDALELSTECDCDRARASKDAILVCEDARVGSTGASTCCAGACAVVVAD